MHINETILQLKSYVKILINSMPSQHIIHYQLYNVISWFLALPINGSYLSCDTFKYTWLSGCFAPIFYFNCEHFLFVYIVYKKTLIFEIWWNWNFVGGYFFNFYHPGGNVRSHIKFGQIMLDFCRIMRSSSLRSLKEATILSTCTWD